MGGGLEHVKVNARAFAACHCMGVRPVARPPKGAGAEFLPRCIGLNEYGTMP
jgi:hypothetical protein